MTKRNPGHPRTPRDFYRTIDPKAAKILGKFVNKGTTFYEPCAGDGSLVRLLVDHAGLVPVRMTDVAPQHPLVSYKNVFDIEPKDLKYADAVITNPPWSRSVLHPLILHLVSVAGIKPVWLLFDSDWMFTEQAKPLLRFCRGVVSVGRLRWIEGTTSVGYDNCCWYKFSGQQGMFNDVPFHF